MEPTDGDRVPFSLRYAGSAVSDGSVDVRKLGDAIIGFGLVCDVANRVLLGRDSRVQVTLRAFAPGSISVQILVTAAGASPRVRTRKMKYVARPKEVAEIFGFVKNAVSVVKAWRGAGPASASDQVYDLLKYRRVQDGLVDVVSPLKWDGVDSLTLVDENGDTETVEPNEVPYFDALPQIIPTEDEVQRETDDWVSVIGIDLRGSGPF